MSKANSLSVFVAGDFYDCGAPSSLGAERLFEGIDGILKCADLRILNFESPIGDKAHCTPIVKSGPNLLAPESAAKLLKGRFDVALLANNHLLDYGPEPLMRTIRVLKANGLKTVGAGKDAASAAKPLTLEVYGRRIGIVNACENEFSLASGNSPGCHGIELQGICEDVRKLRSACDAIIVILHSGNERNPLPSPKALSMRRLIAEADGVTAVLNTHPHSPQGVEVWRGVPIAHSLGNFVFKALWPQPEFFWRIAMPVLLNIRFEKDGAKASLKPLPCIADAETTKLRLLDPDERKRFAAWLKSVSAPLKDTASVKAFFEAWSMESGKQYFNAVQKAKADCSTEKGLRYFASFRNLWLCESHNELISTYVELRFQGRQAEAESLLQQIKKWQAGFPVRRN